MVIVLLAIVLTAVIVLCCVYLVISNQRLVKVTAVPLGRIHSAINRSLGLSLDATKLTDGALALGKVRESLGILRTIQSLH